MSTQNTNTERSREDFAKNYQVIPADGVWGPFAIGNINTVKVTKDGQPVFDENGVQVERRIINVAVKTQQTGNLGASLSTPADWTCNWIPGDYCNVHIKDGWIKKLLPIKAQTISKPVKSSDITTAINEIAKNAQINYGEEDTELQKAIAEQSSKEQENFVKSFESESASSPVAEPSI